MGHIVSSFVASPSLVLLDSQARLQAIIAHYATEQAAENIYLIMTFCATVGVRPCCKVWNFSLGRWHIAEFWLWTTSICLVFTCLFASQKMHPQADCGRSVYFQWCQFKTGSMYAIGAILVDTEIAASSLQIVAISASAYLATVKKKNAKKYWRTLLFNTPSGMWRQEVIRLPAWCVGL